MKPTIIKSFTKVAAILTSIRNRPKHALTFIEDLRDSRIDIVTPRKKALAYKSIVCWSLFLSLLLLAAFSLLVYISFALNNRVTFLHGLNHLITECITQGTLVLLAMKFFVYQENNLCDSQHFKLSHFDINKLADDLTGFFGDFEIQSLGIPFSCLSIHKENKDPNKLNLFSVG